MLVNFGLLYGLSLANGPMENKRVYHRLINRGNGVMKYGLYALAVGTFVYMVLDLFTDLIYATEGVYLDAYLNPFYTQDERVYEQSDAAAVTHMRPDGLSTARLLPEMNGAALLVGLLF